MWACEHAPPGDSRWPEPPSGRSFLLLKDEKLLVTQRMFPHKQIMYDSVFSLDNAVTLNPEEINFAFSIWKSFPDRIVGFPSRVSSISVIHFSSIRTRIYVGDSFRFMVNGHYNIQKKSIKISYFAILTFFK